METIPFPLSGPWPYLDYPKQVVIMGRTFDRAVWDWTGYDNSVAQYRQACPKKSLHLFVGENGYWRIDHLDDYNPDWGPLNIILHLVMDVIPCLRLRG